MATETQAVQPPIASPIEPAAGTTYQVASQWQLMWWKFTRHRLAVVAGCVVLAIYAVSLFAEILAPTDPNATTARYTYAPPQAISLLHRSETGELRLLPHVNGFKVQTDPRSFRRSYTTDPATIIRIGLFVKGAPYKMWGLIPWDRHLIGPLNPRDPFY